MSNSLEKKSTPGEALQEMDAILNRWTTEFILRVSRNEILNNVKPQDYTYTQLALEFSEFIKSKS